MQRLREWAKRPRNQKLIRMAIAALLGTAIGLSCGHLPEPMQPLCRVAAKAIGMFGGR